MRPPWEPQAFTGRAREVMSRVLTILRGGLTLTDNVKIKTVSHTFGGSADTEENVDISSMKLDAAPTYLWALQVDDGAVVYASDTANWTANQIKAKSSKANTTAIITVI